MTETNILSLPLHVVAAVLSELDSVYTLGRAILSHPIFYTSFQEAKDRIVFDAIPPDVLEYALATEEALKVNVQDLLAVKTFAASLFSDQQDGIPKRRYDEVDRKTAAAVVRRHLVVECFTKHIVRDMLPHIHASFWDLLRPWADASNFRVTATERLRVQRALYRIEMFFILFPYPGWYHQRYEYSMAVRDAHGAFFGRFPPWVNEQFACVQDYLGRIIAEAFDDSAAHDVEWGYRKVVWQKPGFIPLKQSYITYGLEFVFTVTAMTSFEERTKLLTERQRDPAWRLLREHWDLPDRLNRDHVSLYHNSFRRHHFQNTIYLRPENRRLWVASDNMGSGSHRTWECIYQFTDGRGQGNFTSHMCDHVKHEAAAHDYRHRRAIAYGHASALRWAGFVLWGSDGGGAEDHAEEVDTGRDPAFAGRLSEGRMDLMLRYFRYMEARDVNKDRHGMHMRMGRSWEARRKIYEAGGRGYWADGDESRIVWGEPDGKEKGKEMARKIEHPKRRNKSLPL